VRFFVETYGCTMNQGESEDLALDLLSLGHQRVESEDDADLFLINTCVVIKATETKILRRLRQLNQTGKPLVIAGCLPSVSDELLSKEFPQSLHLAPSQYLGFKDMVRARFGQGESPLLEFQLHNVIGILPISQGCLGNCSYCLTKKARGNLSSYGKESIVRRMRALVKGGSKEIQMTAQDTGCYGLDIGSNLGEILDMVQAIDGDFMVRVGMMNPDSLGMVMEDIRRAWSGPKVYKFLHLPVQSGSDRVLEAMKRGYVVRTFEDQVRSFRSIYPRMSLSTDIITGFPGETDDDHRASVELIERIRPSIINVTRFSPRPGTPAAKARSQVPGWVSKERSREMTELRFRLSTEFYHQFLGEDLAILLIEKGKGDSLVGRSMEYAPVAIPAKGHDLGEWVRVRVVGAASTHLLGTVTSKIVH
jgi:threonylcarbamoyladenosine tRNA methylthiotransferase CDKAL1